MKSVPDEIRLCRVLDGFTFICKADFIRVYTDFIVSKASDFIRVRVCYRFAVWDIGSSGLTIGGKHHVAKKSALVPIQLSGIIELLCDPDDRR